MDVIDQNQEEDPPMAIEDSDNAIEDDVEDDDDGEDEENASENEEEGEKDTVVDEDQFMFREGTNPLDLIHNNDSGIQLYQRLQQYEAEANKKRKAPEEQCHR
ncbi:transcription factor tau subunit sfc4 [Trifolium pratense]|uniref:Transcription factor tau subunit sfc4 n=2 Tax=Trifolium pratense TaxID=57577 RepID=A0A2K3JQ19_TRIPR|nr:transcription factor tau subunit sfc4 [Trifolium pratense]